MRVIAVVCLIAGTHVLPARLRRGGEGRVLCPPGRQPEYPDAAGHVHRARRVRPRDVRDPPGDAEPGHPRQHRVRRAVYRQRFRGARLRRGQPRDPVDQARQQGLPRGRALRNLGAQTVQPAARRGGRLSAHGAAGLRHHPRGQRRRAHHRYHRHPRQRSARGLRAGPDAAVPHAHGRPAALLRPVGEGLPGKHRHPLLPDLGARTRRSCSNPERRTRSGRPRWASSFRPACICCRSIPCRGVTGTTASATSA